MIPYTHWTKKNNHLPIYKIYLINRMLGYRYRVLHAHHEATAGGAVLAADVAGVAGTRQRLAVALI
jgi:hypothetical protein